MYSKDGVTKTFSEIKKLYPTISFGTNTLTQLGWTLVEVTPLPPLVPFVVSPFQAKVVLAEDGKLAAVEAVVAMADVKTQLAWKEALEFKRNSPTIAAVAAILEWSEGYLDELFTRAAEITA